MKIVQNADKAEIEHMFQTIRIVLNQTFLYY